MKFYYNPKTKLEKFGFRVYSALVDNFPRTFFVGGSVRDWLLHKKTADIDLATEAEPDEVIKQLGISDIDYDSRYKNFGIIIAKLGNFRVEIASFRKETYKATRYPKIQLIKDPKQDSIRRDFTVNSLYFSPKRGIIFDYNKGLLDLKKSAIKFIGLPEKRIKEDPLRIVRALRFILNLDFKLEKNTGEAIINNFKHISSISKSRIAKEIMKIKNKNYNNKIKLLLGNKNLLTNFIKSHKIKS